MGNNVGEMTRCEDTGELVKVQPYPELVADAASPDPTTKLAAVQSAYNILKEDFYRNVRDIISSGIMPILVECLEPDNNYSPTIQLEAARVLACIAHGSEKSRAVVEAGAVPIFVRLLESEDENLCKQSARALWYIIEDREEFRDIVYKLGAIPLVLALIKANAPVPVLRYVAAIIKTLCQRKEPPPPVDIEKDLLPAFLALIQHTDTKLLVHTIEAMAYVVKKNKDQMQIILYSDVIPFLVPLIGHPDVDVQREVLDVIGSMATGTEEQTQVILDHGTLSYFPTYLSRSTKMHMDAFWFLSNVAAGNNNQRQAVIDAGLIPLIIYHLSKSNCEIQKGAAWVINNIMIHGQPEQFLFVVNNGAITPFCDLLKNEQQESELIKEMLDAISNVLKNAGKELENVCHLIEWCGGVPKIEKLQNDVNEDIRKLASEIINSYFTEIPKKKLKEHHNAREPEHGDLLDDTVVDLCTIEFGQPPAQVTSGTEDLPCGIPQGKVTSETETIPSEIPQDKVMSGPEAIPSEIPQDKVTSAPEALPNGIPQDKVTSAPEALPNGLPQDKVTSAPEAIPTGKPQDKVTSAPEALPSGKPQDKVTSAPDAVPVNLSHDINQKIKNVNLMSKYESLSLISTITQQEKMIKSLTEQSTKRKQQMEEQNNYIQSLEKQVNKQNENINSLEQQVTQQSEKIKSLEEDNKLKA